MPTFDPKHMRIMGHASCVCNKIKAHNYVVDVMRVVCGVLQYTKLHSITLHELLSFHLVSG